MTAIMLSMQPQWCAKILNGEKTIEIRKRFPLDYVGWVYVYVTKPKRRYRIGSLGFFSDELYRTPKGEIKFGTSVELMAYDDYDKNNFLNGKVVARLWCDGVTKLKWGRWVDQDKFNYYGYKYEWKEMLDKSLLSEKQLMDYGQGSKLYAIHITRLEIFDKPKELGEFHTAYKYATIEAIKDYERETGDTTSYRVKKAPQSWQYVEVEE